MFVCACGVGRRGRGGRVFTENAWRVPACHRSMHVNTTTRLFSVVQVSGVSALAGLSFRLTSGHSAQKEFTLTASTAEEATRWMQLLRVASYDYLRSLMSSVTGTGIPALWVSLTASLVCDFASPMSFGSCRSPCRHSKAHSIPCAVRSHPIARSHMLRPQFCLHSFRRSQRHTVILHFRGSLAV